MRVKTLYGHFKRHDIPVVRMGLQPTQELNTGAALVAGPFHPAFGELVHAALWRDVLQKAFDRRGPAESKCTRKSTVLPGSGRNSHERK